MIVRTHGYNNASDEKDFDCCCRETLRKKKIIIIRKGNRTEYNITDSRRAYNINYV